LFHSRRPFGCSGRGNNRGGNDNCFTMHFRSRLSRGHVDVYVSLQSVALHRFATDRPEFIIIRALVHNRSVVVGNIRNVGRLTNDRDVAFRRKKRLLDARCAEFARGHKAILVRTNVVVAVGPIANAGPLIEASFRRERRPTDIITAFAPRHPCGGPLISRDPDPAHSMQSGPAAIVISGPTEWFF